MATKKQQSIGHAKLWYAVAVSRILLGWVFLWAFLDKLFGLKFATAPAKAWLNGGSPTAGFLKGVHGPYADMFHGLSGFAWADWLFMLGLLGIGVALIVGCGLRIGAAAGSLLLLLMWAAVLPIANNPFVDEHLVYIPLLWIIAFSEPRLSLANWWRNLPFVRSNRWLC